MASPRQSLSIALLHGSNTHISIAGSVLRLLGHVPTTFTETANLLRALSNAQRFDLLILSPQDEVTYKSLSAVSAASSAFPCSLP